MFIPRNVNNLVHQMRYSPNSQNFNDYVRYARGAIRHGQTPNAQGFEQFLGPQSPGGGKEQQGAPPVAPGVTMPPSSPQTGMAPPPSVSRNPIKGGIRPQQYGAALARMK